MKFRYHFYNFFTIDYRYKVSFYTQYVTYKRNSGCLFFSFYFLQASRIIGSFVMDFYKMA